MAIFSLFRKKLTCFTPGNVSVLGSILISALLLIAIRCLCPLLVLLDEGTQIEAAQNLVSGFGLTSLFSAIPSSNLNVKPEAGLLTWWPPGFSLLLSALLYIKIPLSASLKIIYSCTTALGWLGWGIIASYLLSKPILSKARKIYLNVFIAALVPIFYTPRWVNTDIFLWAGLPYIILLLSSISHNDKENHYRAISISGLVIGLLYFCRYASLGILLGSLALVLIANRKSTKRAVCGCLSLIASFSVVFFPVYIYNKIAGNSIGLPEYINPGVKLFSPDYILGILSESYNLLSLFGYPFPPRPGLTPHAAIDSIFTTYPWLNAIVVLLSCTLLFWIPILIYLRVYRRRQFNIENTVGFYTYVYILVTSLFLFLTSFLFEFNFFGNPRYYIPFICVYIFLFYNFLSNAGFVSVWARRLTLLYLVTVLCTSILFPSLFFAATLSQILKLDLRPTSYFEKVILGYSLTDKDDTFITNFQESADYLEQLVLDNPEAIFFTQYPSAYFDRDFRDSLRAIPLEKFWESAYVERPTPAFFITISGDCPSICSSYLPEKPIEALVGLPNLKFYQDIYKRYQLRVYRTMLDAKTIESTQ